MDSAQDLHRPFRIGHRGTEQRSLVSPALALSIFRRSVPGARHHDLVIRDLFVFDVDPVSQRATRCFFNTEAFAVGRPGLGIPELGVGRGIVAGLEIRDQAILLFKQPFRGQPGLQPPGGRAAERREQRGRL